MARNLDWGFKATGCDSVDAILEAVSRAGKAYHNIEQWNDTDVVEPSVLERIQTAANEAAAATARLAPVIEALREIEEWVKTAEHYDGDVDCDCAEHRVVRAARVAGLLEADEAQAQKGER